MMPTNFTNVMKLSLLAVAFLLSAQVCAQPKVAVSIMPVHSLVAGVMDGVATPDLLLPGGASPHTFTLRPSDAKMISQADIVFWVGPTLEGFMKKTLAASKAKSVALIDSVGARLPPREGGVWDEHEHGDDHGHDHHGDHDDDHGHAAVDPHIWLDPVNAQAMVGAIEKALVEADAVHAARYQRNAAALREKLQALDKELAALLAHDGKASFIVFHDAFQYFEKRYGLSGAGSITVNPEQKPSAKRLVALRERVQKSNARCVFAEPQFNDGLLNSLIEGSQAKRGTLDPLGTREQPGKDAYFLTMRHLAQAAHLCLSDQP